MNPYKDVDNSSFTAPHFTYEDIATKLLKDHYFLTALELHTELVEVGKELPQLREFFSNPGNFEQHVTRTTEFGSMQRTPSQGTLDSLDTARYSEDGGGDRGGSGGDVAVLEFELRKARETINSLRANLTQFADGDTPLDKTTNSSDTRSLMKHEKRALNFLINEYLLLHDYKLTSITFSDENPDQDFEDWDDVGLIMPRPSSLATLFRGTEKINVSKTVATEVDFEMTNVDCQTDYFDIDSSYMGSQSHLDSETDWNHELLIQAEEIDMLKQKVIALETEKLNFQKLYDAAIVSLNSITTPVLENKNLELNIPQERQMNLHSVQDGLDNQPITKNATENHYGSENSTHSVTPEQFEMIESDKTLGGTKKGSSNTSSFDPANIGEASGRGSPRQGSVNTLDETLSINDGGEWTRVQYEYNSLDNASKETWMDSGLPESLKNSLLNWCCESVNPKEPLDNDLLAELVNSDKPITLDGFLTLVAETLPRTVPHTLVSRRCESLSAVTAAAHLSAAHRPRLTQLLLTAHKKPDPHEARLICEAACLLVKWGNSGELLSSIAELLTSRSPERRVLASQICLSIAPYVPIELCTSLLLSLVILMCESGDIEVRSLGLRAACMMCPIADHKYGQLENIMFSFLRDPYEKNVKDTLSMFVPVLARTALFGGKFANELCTKLVTNLTKSVTDKDWKNIQLYIDVLGALVVAKLCYVINVQIVKDVVTCDIEMSYQEVPLEGADGSLDSQCYLDNAEIDFKTLVANMNSLIKDSPDVRWNELNWFIGYIKQILDILIKCKCLNQSNVYDSLITLFSNYVNNFGQQFTKNVLREIFLEIMLDLEEKMEKLQAINVDSTAVVGIYLATILPTLQNDDEIGTFLHKWLLYGSLRNLPVKMLSSPFKWLAKNNSDLLVKCMEYVAEQPSGSSAAAVLYRAEVLCEVLEGVDLPPMGLNHALDAVGRYLEHQDPAVLERGISCWGAGSGAAARAGGGGGWAARGGTLAALTPSAAARAAHAVTLLIITAADRGRQDLVQQAVSVLCGAISPASISADSLSSLSTAFQLALTHDRGNQLLGPALRIIEEAVQSPSLSQFKPTVEALSSCLTGGEGAARAQPSALVAGAHDVTRRVTQMLNSSKTNINIHNIFKKKT